MRFLSIILFLIYFACDAQDLRELEVKAIIQGIAKDNNYDSEGIGAGGIKSKQRYRFEKLKEKSTKQELIEATSHPNSVVVCYAFEALVEKKDTIAGRILLSHLSNTTTLSTQMGCIMGSISVKYFMLRLYSLNSEQFKDIKDSLDSFALSDIEQEIDNLPLELQHQNGYLHKNEILMNLEPKPEYYKRLKNIYDKKSSTYPSLIVPISKYHNPSDTSLILASIKTVNKWNVTVLHAVNEFPHSSFFSSLVKLFHEYKDPSSIEPDFYSLLLLNLSNYEKPETTDLFEEVLSFEDFNCKMCLYDAISDKPYFQNILDQIKFKKQR